MAENGSDEQRERHPYHRRFVRHKVRLRVVVAQGRSHQSWTQNLSLDGLCFVIPQRIAPGQQVEVWIYPPRRDDRQPIRSYCQVIWHAAVAGKTRHGAQFVGFAADGRERLARLLAALTRPPTQPPPP